MSPVHGFHGTRRLTTFSLVALLGTMAAGDLAVAQQAANSSSQGIPQVFLSTGHRKLTKVKVGDVLPEAQLTNARDADAGASPLAVGNGRAATVVAVFSGRGRMTRTMLRDLRHDVAETYAKLDTGPEAKRAVSTTAIAVNMSAADATALGDEVGYTGAMVLDPEGEYFAQLGTGRLPRVYVLDAAGKIVWMDIEYSPATRRELRQTLQALTAKLPK